jgi:hypothetical protein
LLDGDATQKQLRDLEQSIATHKISVWLAARNRALAHKPDDDPEMRELLQTTSTSPGLAEKILHKGFVWIVEDVTKNDQQQVARAVAALLCDPERLVPFVESLFRAGLPGWCRIAPSKTEPMGPADELAVGATGREPASGARIASR